MTKTTNLLETLKKYLKAKGITYNRLAAEMNLSETSIKRLFSKQTFSLTRLEEICRILDIDFYDLVLMDKQRNMETTDVITIEQEKALVGDEKLGIFLYFLANGWLLSQIIEKYDYSETEAIQMLGKLEKLGLLEVYPNNRVHTKVSANVFWLTDTQARKANFQTYADDFLNNSFDLPNDRLVFSPGQFSKASLKIIKKKIENLIKEYNQLAGMDAKLPIEGRYSTGMFIGFRPWVFTRIAELRRQPKSTNLDNGL